VTLLHGVPQLQQMAYRPDTIYPFTVIGRSKLWKQRC